jgi:hypothetical protein
MTERYGPGYGEESGQRPSGRGAVTERLARHDGDVSEIDLTDEATARASSGAFEPASPAAPTADPPAADRPADDAAPAEPPAAEAPAPEAARTGSTSIFDVDERDKQEDEHPTGYEPPVADADAGANATADGPAAAPADGAGPATLLGSLDAADLRNRFLDIQAGFIDEPRQAVEEAGRFVDELLGQVADLLQQQRGQLAGATDEASTEDLRLALRAYRQFVDRLLGLAT